MNLMNTLWHIFRASRHRAWAIRFYNAEKKHFAAHLQLKKAAKRHWAKHKQHQYWLAENARFLYRREPYEKHATQVEGKNRSARTPVANGHAPHSAKE